MTINISKLRLFKTPLLEACTHVHPIVPLIMWTPIISFLFWRNYMAYHHSLSIYALTMFTGLLVWSLVEYVLHRYGFHFAAKSWLGKRLVFLFHGLHHDDPSDATRLVMPPLPGIVLGYMFYLLFSTIVAAPYLDLFFAFFMIGYLIYDYIHYATHHFPMTNPIGRFLKKYHLQHHYSGDYCKFGVSNPLWDYVFRSVGGPIEVHTWEWDFPKKAKEVI